MTTLRPLAPTTRRGPLAWMGDAGRWLLGASLALATACGSSDPAPSEAGAAGATSGAGGAATSGAGGTSAATGGTAGGTTPAGAGGTSAGTGGSTGGTSAGTGGASGSNSAGSASGVCPGSYFCDDFEDLARSTELWKPVTSPQFTFPTFVTSPTAHSGTRVMHAEATRPAGGQNAYNLAFVGIGKVDPRPAAVSFAFRLLQGDSTQQLLQFDAFDDAATKAGFELQLKVDGGQVTMSVVDFDPFVKPGFSSVTLGPAQVGAWTTVDLSVDFTGPAPGVSGSINGGAPSAVLPFAPRSVDAATRYRLEMTMGTFSILGGTNAVDLDDVDVRPR